MKRSLILLIVALLVIPGKAQYIPSLGVERPAPKKDGYWHYGNTFEHLKDAPMGGLLLGHILLIGVEKLSAVVLIAPIMGLIYTLKKLLVLTTYQMVVIPFGRQ